MKHLRLAALLVLSLALTAATCVRDVEQKGEAGPWVGEVVNAGPQTVYGVAATARIEDADGREFVVGRAAVLTCPSKLLPGEHGAFAMFSDQIETAPFHPPLANPALPLRAAFDALAYENIGTGQARGDGLLVTLLERDAARSIARVRLTNNGTHSADSLTVCGILRTPDGKVAAVARADAPAMPYNLFPGESIDLELRFDTMPDGDIRFHALGLQGHPYEECCPPGASTWRGVDAGPFSVLLPPGWAYEPAQGIDSFVGTFAGGGARLGFDYGIYSNSLPYDGDPAYEVHFETIGGYTAKLVRPLGAGLTGVYFDDLGEGILGSRTRLQVSGQDLTPEQQRIALQIFRSLRFDP